MTALKSDRHLTMKRLFEAGGAAISCAGECLDEFLVVLLFTQLGVTLKQRKACKRRNCLLRIDAGYSHH